MSPSQRCCPEDTELVPPRSSVKRMRHRRPTRSTCRTIACGADVRRPATAADIVADERGSVAAELTLLVPALILLLLFVVFCGRLASARLELDDAAHQAARAATLSFSSTQATSDARATATAALSQAGITCQNMSVDAAVGNLAPGSTVTVTLTCHIGLSDLALLGVPGSVAASASASSVVDQWRSTPSAGAGP